MGLSDRDYMRGSGSGPRWGGGSYSSPSTLIWWIIGLNALVFILPSFTGWGLDPNRNRLGGVSLEALRQGHVWTLITYQFVHSTLLHLGFNMALLYFLGRTILLRYGQVGFLGLYCVGGIVGALFNLGISGLFGQSPGIIGASASVSAILAAFVLMDPRRPLRLFPFPFVIPGIHLLWGLLIMNGVFGLMTLRGEGGIAYLAHLGGALYGMLHYRYLGTGTLQMPPWFRAQSPKARSRAKPNRTQKTPEYQSRGKDSNIIDAKFTNEPGDYNAILDKINREGISSLTPEERRILEEASEKLGKQKR